MADKKSILNLNQKSDLGFMGELMQQIKLVYHLLRDRDVPIYLKVVPFLGLIYVLSPIDLSFDLVPVLGQIDDLMILTIASKVFIELAPAEVVAKYTGQLSGQKVVEGAADEVEKAVKVIEAEATDTPAPADVAKKNGKRR